MSQGSCSTAAAAAGGRTPCVSQCVVFNTLASTTLLQVNLLPTQTQLVSRCAIAFIAVGLPFGVHNQVLNGERAAGVDWRGAQHRNSNNHQHTRHNERQVRHCSSLMRMNSQVLDSQQLLCWSRKWSVRVLAGELL